MATRLSLTELVRELPTVTMAMTEPMPMMMPSMVSSARILLLRSPPRASLMFSQITAPGPLSLRR